jgi:hypothetical protein
VSEPSIRLKLDVLTCKLKNLIEELDRMVNKKIVLVGIVIITALVLTYFTQSYFSYLDYLDKTIHETDRWVVIMDSKGDIIAVETTSDDIWNTFIDLHQNQTEMWIGGIVEEYKNKWGFRFDLNTIIIAQVTIEGAQSNIQGISGDLEYWIDTWSTITYVFAKVIEIHV